MERNDDYDLVCPDCGSTKFDWIEYDESDVGVSAQSIQSILNEAVKPGKDGKLTVNYGNAALVACIKLAQRVLELEKKTKFFVKIVNFVLIRKTMLQNVIVAKNLERLIL